MSGTCRNTGSGGFVIFTGEREDVPDTLAMFDVSVHCSLTDNLGHSRVPVDGRPMVVSEIPGFADTVRHDETGLAVPADDPEALAASIVRLLWDRAGRRLGRAGAGNRTPATTSLRTPGCRVLLTPARLHGMCRKTVLPANPPFRRASAHRAPPAAADSVGGQAPTACRDAPLKTAGDWYGIRSSLIDAADANGGTLVTAH